LFGRLLTETGADGQNGMINLKYSGTLPLVEAVRLMALKHGVADTSTLGRLKGLRECDAIDDDQFDYLTGGLNHLTRLLLRQQLSDFKAGNKVTNFVPKASLSKREKEYLADCFRAIQDLRGRLASEFSGDF
jgi:signal-transduction protein with cAMP-binding, CBS, and nucleotidyltransferase domain